MTKRLTKFPNRYKLIDCIMKIPILHLEDGIHTLEEQVSSESLHFSGESFYPFPVDVTATLNKFGANLRCRVQLSTRQHFRCDRCLSEFDQPFQGTFEVLFHIGKDTWETDEDDVVHLSRETIEVDLSDRIREYLLVSVPMKRLCSEACRGICPGCGCDLNHEECQCGEKPPDPRWEKLLQLKK